MSLDTTIALISVDEAKTMLGIDIVIEEVDRVRFENIINMASKWIERYTGRKFITPAAAISEVFDGDDTVEYYTRNIPITSTILATNLQYRNNTGDNWASITATFSYDTTTGRIYTTDGYVFDRGKDNWKVTYNYGYAQDSVPWDLKMACAELVAISKKKFDDKAHGVSSVSFPEQTISYKDDQLPHAVKMLIAPYKRIC